MSDPKRNKDHKLRRGSGSSTVPRERSQDRQPENGSDPGRSPIREEQRLENVYDAYELRIAKSGEESSPLSGENDNNHPDHNIIDELADDNYLKRHIYMESNAGRDTCIETFLIILSYVLTVSFFPFSILFIFVVVRQFERAVILRNGKVRRDRPFGPGLIHYLPCVDAVKYTDLRIFCYAIPPQEALTKDSLTVTVDAVVNYQIHDPICAVINVADFESSTQFLAATTLRNTIGTRNLSHLLTDRPAVSYQVYLNLRRVAQEWGIKVVRVEIKNICLPLQLQKAMAAEAESSRIANAKIIVANAEIEATKNLQKAVALLMENPFSMQLRYLQSLHLISSDKTHTVVFPFSIEAFRKILK